VPPPTDATKSAGSRPALSRAADFAHAARAVQFVRRRRTVTTGRITRERVYGVTSLRPSPGRTAGPRLLGARALGRRERNPLTARAQTPALNCDCLWSTCA
jgi:hypothetical protein